MRICIIACLVLALAQSCSAQTITIISSWNSAEVPASYVSSDEDFQMFDGWDSGATDAEVEIVNQSAIDSDLGFTHLDLLRATAESFVYSGLPSAEIESFVRAEFNFGGILTSGDISYSAFAESTATLQLDGANPLDILDVRIVVSGGAGALGPGLMQGDFGFEYEGTYFDAVVRGAPTEEESPYEYHFDDVENTMDFYFDGVAVTTPAMEETFYVELASGSQIDVSCYASAFGSSISYSNNDLNGGQIGDVVISRARLNVDILP